MPATVAWTLNEKRLKALQKKLGPTLVLPPVGDLIRTMADLTQAEASQKAPRDTGALASSIAKDVEPLQAKIATTLPYARVMEAGRKPLVAGGKMPPPSALRRIASPGTEFALARSIQMRGIRGRFFFRKARAKAYKELPRVIKKAQEAIETAWAKTT